jgi:signal transduction histidine kinase
MLAGERDRIAREMHDGVVQSLFSISLGLEVCKKQLFRDPTAVSVRLEELQQHLTSSMSELRRLVYDLRPKSLSEHGLKGSLETWVEQATAGRGIEATVRVEGQPTVIPASTEACLFRVAKEAVSNAARHSGASRIDVLLRFDDKGMALVVTDDGRGFDLDQMLETGTGIGLRSIRERVLAEGGTLTVDSEPGTGTRIQVEV